MGAGASRAASGHRSLNCRIPTVVEFVNDTPHAVRTVWRTYAGAPKEYYLLPPGGRVRQPTFSTHPWEFVVPDDPGVLLVVDNQTVFYPPPLPAPGAPPVQARITIARDVPWSPQTHHLFPSSFRAGAAALLCCHHRLERQGAAGDGGAALTPRQGWMRRVRRSLSGVQAIAPASPPAPGSAADSAPACSLCDLPKDLVLDILAAATPWVPLLVKPPLPQGLEAAELPPNARQLFRFEGSPAGQAGGEAEAEAEPEAAAGVEAAEPAGAAAAELEGEGDDGEGSDDEGMESDGEE